MTRGTGNSVRLSRHLTDTAGIGARASNETAKASFKPLFDSSIRPHDAVDPTDPASRTSAATNSRYVIPRATAFTFTLALAAQSRVEIIETRAQECSLVLVSQKILFPRSPAVLARSCATGCHRSGPRFRLHREKDCVNGARRRIRATGRQTLRLPRLPSHRRGDSSAHPKAS